METTRTPQTHVNGETRRIVVVDTIPATNNQTKPSFIFWNGGKLHEDESEERLSGYTADAAVSFVRRR